MPPVPDDTSQTLLIAGIVLAAGRSRRMGQPKALLPAAGASFLRHVIEALRGGGCDPVLVVVAPPVRVEAREIARAARDYGAEVVVNPSGELEQIDSLRTALHSLPDSVRAVVVTPVDFPLVRAETTRALVEAYRARRAPIVLPAYRGVHGHPVLFARDVFRELLTGSLPEGARSVVHAHRAELEEVTVHDEGVLQDVDTPADYRRLLETERT
ncbi:nucleotidyltransferase family protein [soil metagenome]